MRVKGDEGKCQGHTLFAMSAPGVFSLREDDGHSYVAEENTDVRPEDEAAVRQAAASCPERAIVVVE